MRRLRALATCLFLSLITWAAHSASAHDPGLSFAEIRIGATETTATLAFARRELESLVAIDANGDGTVSGPEFTAARAQLEDLAPVLLTVRAGSSDLPPYIAAIEINDSDAVRFDLRYETAAEGPLRFGTPVIARLARGHRQYLSIRADDDRAVVDRILNAHNAVVTVALPNAASAQQSAFHQLATFIREGVRHIWIGFDHVLFLITLLLPVVLRRHAGVWEGVERLGTAFRQVALVVTAFTIAHSITLSLAVLGIVDLPTRLTESVIAASVIVAALNNLWPVVSHRLWAVAFAFGLVHGLGFAGALTDLGLPRGSETMALLGFNLGVEIGQLVIVAALLPLLYGLRRTTFYRQGAVQLGSLAIATVAGVWLVERAFDLVILPT